MFGYLRVFILVSLISVVLIAVMVGFYLRSMSMQDLTALTENKNNILITSYVQAAWEVHPYPPVDISRRNIALNEQRKSQFLEHSRRFLGMLSFDYFAIYDKSGQPIYVHSGDPTSILDVSKRIAELTQSQDEKLSLVIAKPTNEYGKDTKTLRTFTALGSDSPPEFYVEIHSDITDAYNKVVLQQWVVSGSIIIVFLLLIWMLIQTSKRAEYIIARQHENNMELAKKAAVAEAENEQKSLFLANISHELRTPLNAIIGFSDIMRQQMPVDEEFSQHAGYMHDIHNAGVHLLSLINDILDFSKAEAGKLDIDIVEVNFNKMVKHCLRLVSPRAEEANIQLSDATPKDTLVLYTDNKKLKQILLNLLSNAVKFTPENGIVRVNAWRNLQDETIGFEIKDNGIGMAPKDISKAMSPFGQIDNALSRKYEGTGLGLPLTKKFVELMGGDFKIESEENIGTTITINLPVEYRGLESPPATSA